MIVFFRALRWGGEDLFERLANGAQRSSERPGAFEDGTLQDGSVRASYCRGLQRPFCDRLVEEAAEAKEKATAAIAIEH